MDEADRVCGLVGFLSLEGCYMYRVEIRKKGSNEEFGGVDCVVRVYRNEDNVKVMEFEGIVFDPDDTAPHIVKYLKRDGWNVTHHIKFRETWYGWTFGIF